MSRLLGRFTETKHERWRRTGARNILNKLDSIVPDLLVKKLNMVWSFVIFEVRYANLNVT